MRRNNNIKVLNQDQRGILFNSHAGEVERPPNKSICHMAFKKKKKKQKSQKTHHLSRGCEVQSVFSCVFAKLGVITPNTRPTGEGSVFSLRLENLI